MRATESGLRGAQTIKRNKSSPEVRTLIARTVAPERVGFVAATQTALLHRRTIGREPETVYLVTSRKPERLAAATWLLRERRAWNIENGLHQRLDASAAEDDSRIRHRNAVRVLAKFRRLGVSVVKERKGRDQCRGRDSLRDFQDALSRRAQRGGFALIAAHGPSLCYSSWTRGHALIQITRPVLVLDG